jgi:hypothetical protein
MPAFATAYPGPASGQPPLKPIGGGHASECSSRRSKAKAGNRLLAAEEHARQVVAQEFVLVFTAFLLDAAGTHTANVVHEYADSAELFDG